MFLTRVLPFCLLILLIGVSGEVARAQTPEDSDVDFTIREDFHTRPLSPYEANSAAETNIRQREWLAEPHHTEMPDYIRAKVGPPRTMPHQAVEATTTDSACELELLAEKEGRDLIDQILSSPLAGCLANLLEGWQLTSSARSSIFRMANMLTVAEESKVLGANYQGERAEDVRKFLFFLRAAYYSRFYHDAEFDWHEAPGATPAARGCRSSACERVTHASMEALDVLFENGVFLTLSSEEHGDVATEAFRLTYWLDISRYIPTYKDWLRVLSVERVQYQAMISATDTIFGAFFRGHYGYYVEASVKEEILATIGSDSEWVEIMLEVALLTEIHDVAIVLSENAARELSRFLQYGSPTHCSHCPIPIFPSLVSAVRTIFNTYEDVSGEGVSVKLIAARVVDDIELCELIGSCDLREEVEAVVLPISHQCQGVPVTIRAQSLTERQRANACEKLIMTEARFHRLLMTQDSDPVEEDNNDYLHIIVFEDDENYRTYSRFLFGNSTNNGGIFREGDPAGEQDRRTWLGRSSTPLVIVYEAYWIIDPDPPILGLAHEYAHYLDGRFVKRGASWDYGNSIVGWAEGLAEYIFRFNENRWAMELIRDTVEDRANFGQILRATYRDSVELAYGWSYLAVRFLFEQHPAEVQKIIGLFRAGKYSEYEEYIDELAAFDDDFSRWLEVVGNVNLTEIDLGEPVSTAEGRATVNLLPYFFMDDEASRSASPPWALREADVIFAAEVEGEDGVASVIVQGAFLIIRAVSPGVATVRVSATYRGLVWRQSFEAVVTNECPAYLCERRPPWRWAVWERAGQPAGGNVPAPP